MAEHLTYHFLATRKPDLDQGLTEEEFAFVDVHWLKQPRAFERLYATALYLDEAHEWGLALQLARRLQGLLSSSSDRTLLDATDEERLQQIIAILKVVGVALLRIRDVEGVFQASTVMALRAGLNLAAGLQAALISYGEPELAVNASNTILRVIGLNLETIGETPLTVPENPERLDPTVQNWLRAYNGSFPLNQERGPVERAHFLQRDANVKRLNNADREILTKLLETYDLLRFPHKAPIVEERTVQEPVVERVGGKAITDFASAAVTAPALGHIVAAYRGGDADQRAVTEAVSGIRAKAGNDQKKLAAEFFAAVQSRNVPRTVATMRLLAENDQLERLLANDQALQQHLRSVWPSLYGQAAADTLVRQPLSRQSVQLFIQYVLQERLDVPEHDAARVGAQLSNIFKQRGRHQYEKLAYFDVREKTFKWLP
ncbi:MAG: hypothetical protein Q7S23_02070 [bacterium]|nr:hypothetical protein [bacterium]